MRPDDSSCARFTIETLAFLSQSIVGMCLLGVETASLELGLTVLAFVGALANLASLAAFHNRNDLHRMDTLNTKDKNLRLATEVIVTGTQLAVILWSAYLAIISTGDENKRGIGAGSAAANIFSLAIRGRYFWWPCNEQQQGVATLTASTSTTTYGTQKVADWASPARSSAGSLWPFGKQATAEVSSKNPMRALGKK